MRFWLTSLVLLGVLATSAHAQGYKVGSLVIDHPWTRATPKSAAVAGGYVKITNTGNTADRLTGGSADVSRKFEVQEMRMARAVRRRRDLKEGLEIPRAAIVDLKPGSI